ncbi:MAG: beta-N-acetylhexosaminidase [Acidimicrobiales bacterium]
MSPVPAAAIIPRPLRILEGAPGTVGAVLADGLVIVHPPELAREARWFRRVLETSTGWAVHVTGTGTGAGTGAGADDGAGHSVGNSIELRIDDLTGLPSGLEALIPGTTRREAYRLTASRGELVITAPDGAGAFYALQTLRQLLPDSLFRQAPSEGGAAPIELPDIEIVDAPCFSWRGVHLDVCRHFMPKSFLLKLIDLIALHKCNVFHLHLTEDQGWRIPIARYPRLTEIGAWRSESPVGHYSEGRFDGAPHGGFYTREDLEEIVAFAAERHVNVLPEIDMPGHMVAAIAAYPELGNSGKQLHVHTNWGISKHVLNLEETTLRFCTDVIDEVVDIFPWRCLHVGGDECPTIEWETSPRAKELMHDHGFAEERQLQGWFTARIAEHLATRGRTLVGWDEILEGGGPRGAGSGAPEGSIVMSWRGEAGGIEAAAAGHDVVMAPQEWLYFDWAYSDDPAEPQAIRGATSVERVYSYNPVPDAIPGDQRHHVLGAQCQLWTEYVKTPEHAEYLYFPRLPAFAEVVWTAETADRPRSFAEFEPRLSHHLRRLEALGVNYRPLEGPTPGQARVWREP